MKKKLNVLYIDDDDVRKNNARLLERKSGWGVNFFSVNRHYNVQKQSEEGRTWEDLEKQIKRHPHLILVDHYLTNANPSEFGRQGQAVATRLIDAMEEDLVPVACVSQGLREGTLAEGNRLGYELIVPVDKLSERFEVLGLWSSAFDQCRRLKPISKQDFMRLLVVPKSEQASVERVLPELRLGHNPDERSKNFERRRMLSWINYEFVSFPGLILSEAWAANMIGLTAGAFERRSSLFEKSLYKGIFSSNKTKRYWKGLILEVLRILAKQNMGLPPYKLGHLLPGVRKSDWAICEQCKKHFPETMGFEDDTNSRFVPLHYACSKPANAGSEKGPLFEELRVMVG